MATITNLIPSEGKGEEESSSLPFSLEQIQAAKDFIWEHLEPHTKPLLIELANKSKEERLKNSYSKRIAVRMEADSVTTKEVLIIGFLSNPELSHAETVCI